VLDSAGVGVGVFGSAPRQKLVTNANPIVIGIR
jgi:hypothetical protein